MKLTRLITCVIVLCSAVLMNGCQKDNIDETGTTTTPTVSLKGGLAFKVKDSGGNPIAGVTINIAVSRYDFDNHVYLATRITDQHGHADFGLLNEGNYYYTADVAIDNMHFHGEGVVQVQRSVSTVKELTLQ